MSLILPPWYFTDETDTITTTSTGVQVTLGASSADGSAVRLMPASGGFTHDVHYLVLLFHPNIAGVATNPIGLIDVLHDPAGGTTWDTTNIFINDLITRCNNSSGILSPYSYGYAFPLYIPAGTSLGLRGRTAHTATKVINCRAWAFGNPSHPEMWWCGSKVETLGVQASPAKGTTVTPGLSSAFGSWTNIGGNTSGRYGCIQLGFGGENGTTESSQFNWLEMGYASTKLAGSPRYEITHNVSEQGKVNRPAFPFWCDIPQGTQMQVQIASNVASAVNTCEIALYGVH